jgi:hypothetical protein
MGSNFYHSKARDYSCFLRSRMEGQEGGFPAEMYPSPIIIQECCFYYKMLLARFRPTLPTKQP